MVYKGAIFVNDIIRDVFNLNLTSMDYVNIGGIKCSRNIFSNCVLQNPKYLGYNYATAIKALIMEQTKDNTKKENFFEYLKNYMPDDVKEFINSNPEKLEQIIDLAISKFTNTDNDCDENNQRVSSITKNISELYIKTAKYLKSEREIAFNLIERIKSEMINHIIITENLNIKRIPSEKKILDIISYKNIIPDSILCIIENTLKMTTVKDSSENYNDLLEIIFESVKKITQWFVRDYLNEPLQFSIMNNKAEKKFINNKDENSIKIYDVTELIDKGWTYEKIATDMSNVFDQNIPIRSDNKSSIELMVAKMKHNPELRKSILDSQNKLIGYWHFTPLFDDFFEKSKEGISDYKDITTDEIPVFLAGRYNIEFGAVVLESSYRKTKVFKMLLYSMMEYIEKLALNNIFINEIVTRSASKDGIALIKSIGLKYYKRNKDDTANVYYAKMTDLLDKPYLRDFTLLKQLYKKEYHQH